MVAGVKPFKCDHCDYSTVERSHLKVHIRVHTGCLAHFTGHISMGGNAVVLHLSVRFHSSHRLTIDHVC